MSGEIMHTYLIALGSNLGDRKYHIEQAIEAIRSHCGKVLAVAPILETSPIGAADQLFFNTVLTLESAISPLPLLKKLLEIETTLGRVRAERWGNRTIDLDLILWNEEGTARRFQDNELTIPHPEAHKRDFVLGPALTIAGDWIHPVLGLTLREIDAKKAAQN